MSPQSPLPLIKAWIAVARCVVTTAGLLARHRIHQPRTHIDEWLHFADGTSARVYRETVVDGPPPPNRRSCWWRSGSAAFVAEATTSSGSRAYSTLRSSSGSMASSRSCGWPMTSGEPTAGCTSGTGPTWPRRTHGHCGACWRWSAHGGRSGITSSRPCTATSCSRIRRRSALNGEKTGGS